MIPIFNKFLNFKDIKIPQTILGNSTFIGEPYFGHRSRLYDLDLHQKPEKIAELIKLSYKKGVRAINLVNDESLLKGYDLACDGGCKMDIIATVAKDFTIDYICPNFKKASKIDWKNDIDVFSSYNSKIMLVDEFIIDGYNWDLTSEILSAINETDSFSGLITNYPLKTTDEIIGNLDLDLFQFYMIPINKLGYMMDIPFFTGFKKEKFENKIKQLDKKIIATKTLACGILNPQEAFNFIKSLDYIDFISLAIANEKELNQDFNCLFNI